MSYAADNPVTCKQPGCPNEYHGSKYHAIRAAKAGWFTGKDGDAWCPDHLPEWVVQWRAKRHGTAVQEPLW